MDHIEGNQSLQEATGAPILIHKEDAGMLTSPAQNLSLFVGPELVSPPPGRLLADGDEISWGKQSLRVLHTPGHTPGSISLAGGGVVFSGDTLFARSVGRTDFPGGSMTKLLLSPEKHRICPRKGFPATGRKPPLGGKGRETLYGGKSAGRLFSQPGQGVEWGSYSCFFLISLALGIKVWAQRRNFIK